MSLNEILEQLPKLTEDEKRQLRNILDRELADEGEEGAEFLAELNARVRASARGRTARGKGNTVTSENKRSRASPHCVLVRTL